MSDPAALFRQAQAAREAGRPDEAERLLRQLLAASPGDPRAANVLGLIVLAQGRAAEAAALFDRAIAADPKEPRLRFNLATACLRLGDVDRELAALDAALDLDAYMMPALLQKATTLQRVGRIADALRIFRGILQATPDESRWPEPLRRALAQGRQLVEQDTAARLAKVAGPVARARQHAGDADLGRADAYVQSLAGARKVYVQQPTGAHFPYLPAIEFFDRALFPWFGALEAETDAIREELRTLWSDPGDGFVPYVAYAPGAPVNQWADLNHSPRWSAFFLWKDGVPVEENIARCPHTAAVLARLPMLDIGRRGPTAMFSILAPKTRIPPHTGVTNIRSTVHLPLVVPEGCGFRVGSETRSWVEGVAWGFDDTIEHEAWNDSDRPRAVLIIDCWNPLLSEGERAVVRAATETLA